MPLSCRNYVRMGQKVEVPQMATEGMKCQLTWQAGQIMK